MSKSITFRPLDPAQARDAAPALKSVYAAVFSQPPYSEGPAKHEAFIEWVMSESEHPGFDMRIAEVGGQPVGFAYGYTMPAGEWFRGSDQSAPAEIKDAPKFAVMEWAVLPEHRKTGIGRTLMKSLLDGRPEPWAVLMVNPAAEARAVYQRAGWRQVASTKPTNNWPKMDIMVLDLTR